MMISAVLFASIGVCVCMHDFTNTLIFLFSVSDHDSAFKKHRVS